ncbi:DUF4386 family protein [Segetibacter sp. 3557_3]|uniref:DUF4386 family protein n=1 Tax=Segetibacter sp. 3557_3 TaxID=2547429 RepID=UPI001405177F|nr:DUF4386 family protein [Segetibacter sp. 3557_3]
MQLFNVGTMGAQTHSSSSGAANLPGRKLGIILILQLLTALTLPFILAKPITVGAPAYLTAVAAHTWQVRAAVLLSFVGSALTVYLGITAFQVFWLHSKQVAVLFIVTCTISCTLDIVHAGTILSMLAISKSFAVSGGPINDLYQVVAEAIFYARRSAHATQLLAIGGWMFVFYIALLRFKLIPIALGGLGILGVSLQFIGVTMMMLLGYRAIGEMAMPLLPIHLSTAVWLIAKGLKNQTVESPG